MNHEDRIVKFPYAITPVKNGGAGGPALLPLGDYSCGICMEGGQPGNCINYTGIYCKWNMGESSISWGNACYKTIYCKHESSHSIIRTNKRHVELSQCDISEIADKIFGSIESKMKESIAKVINAHLGDECCEME